MAIPIIGDIIKSIGETIGKAIPDADKQAEINLELAKLADKADERLYQLQNGQIEVNKVEAANSNPFVSGWRPFIGWVCGASMAWTYIGVPILGWVIALWQPDVKLPSINTDYLMELIFAMLGLGTLRTVEKIKKTTI